MDEREKKRNAFLAFLTIVLLAFFIFLIFLFLRMLRPSQTGAADIEGMQLVATIYGKSETDRLNQPTGVAFDDDGNILVTDSNNGRTLRFTQRGRFINEVIYPAATLEKSLGKMNEKTKKLHSKVGQDRYMPGFVATGPDGTIYISYPDRNVIVAFESDFKVKKIIPINDFPLDMAVKGNQLYLSSAHMVRILDLNGKTLFSSGDSGQRRSDLGFWLFPNGITVDDRGMVYVSDSNNNRIVELDPRLKSPRLVSAASVPVGLTVGSGGHLYYLQLIRSDLVIRTKRGQEIKTVSGPGGQDLLFGSPSDIAYGGNQLFAVADKGNNRVQVIRMNY